LQDTHRSQSVEIQFRQNSSGGFRTIRTVRLKQSRGCYFDSQVTFSSSGTVRLKWSYPRGDTRLLDPVTPGQSTIYSRQVKVTIE
jgi:hypothetical protein